MVESKKVTSTRARTKQNIPTESAATSSDELTPERKYVPLFPLLANYWDKRLSELPDELRARVSMQKEKRLVGQRPKFDASGELECDAEGHYPVYEDVYTEHETGDWIISWDALTPEQRQVMARQIDDRHDPAKELDPARINEGKMGLVIGFYFIPHEWGYWAGKPTLVADEAIPLMNGLDPGSWRNRHNRTFHQQLPDEWVAAIERGLKIAEGEKIGHQSPADWLAWGRSHGLDKPTMKSDQRLREPDICMWPLFAQAVAEVERRVQEEIERKANEEAEQAAQEEAQQNDYLVKYGANPSARIYPVWQARLEEIIKESQAINRKLNKKQAAKKLATELLQKDATAWGKLSETEKANKLSQKASTVERHTEKPTK